MYILRITLKSIKKINNLSQNLLELNKFKNIQIKNVFHVKNKKKIFTLLKSPHVNKKSREHFIYKNFIPKIDIKFSNILQLFNFLLSFKKLLIKNILIEIKIIKLTKKCL